MPCHRNAPNGHRIKQLHLARQRMGGTLEQLELTPAQSHVPALPGWSTGPNAQAPRDVEEFFLPDPPHGLRHSVPAGSQRLRIIPDGPGRPPLKRIHVSEKALTCDGQIHDYIEALEKQMVQDFTPEEQAQFSSLLDRAIQNPGRRAWNLS